ncbi:MAG: hypothetical protein H0U92_01295 [Actinobacteria bacterium]|nr:hypothetical protein [Actinomycetota bacterium]
MSEFDAGFIVGLLVGEGHFGGDGRQPQVILRMHVDHKAVFDWVVDRVPGGRLYGPYEHDGRRYYQWMVRGTYLREAFVPFLDDHLSPIHSVRVWSRFEAMKARYRIEGRSEGQGFPWNLQNPRSNA